MELPISNRRRAQSDPRRNGARVMLDGVPPNERAQGRPGAGCTRSLACKSKKHTSKSPQVHRIEPAFPAQWLYGLLRDLPGEPGFLATIPA
jgi:hypothetical protein